MPETVSHPSRPPVGLRERKKAQVQALLVDTAQQLFAEQGFAAVTVDQIVDAADVSRSTFFRYFDTKDAALFHNSRLAMDGMLDNFHARCIDGEPWDALRQALLQAAADFESRRAYFRMLHRLMSEDRGLRASSAEHADSLLAEVTAHYLSHTGDTDPLTARVQVAITWAASAVAMDLWMGDDTAGLQELTARALEALDAEGRGAADRRRGA